MRPCYRKENGAANAAPLDSLKEELLEQKNPYKVEPSEYDTRGDRNENANDKAKDAALLCKGAPSYNDLGHPVNTGDEKKEELNESGLLVKPGHVFLLSGNAPLHYIK